MPVQSQYGSDRFDMMQLKKLQCILCRRLCIYHLASAHANSSNWASMQWKESVSVSSRH